ncbi:organic hydroperoxide resistance protein [Arthrobacter sp. 35W]|uniref:organic hydroperoxide resistance protein n=1 Tax=Arthrobacter sp. 35W TaxID=1132441 RepID=UPI0003FF078E|nr:organic hydroperoxide resistance protein [Arthrobacter sp. 35W]
MKVLYTAAATATGDGRDGHATSSDGRLVVQLASPAELGGDGNGTNPEQLFAAGYAACFHSALRVVARRAKADVSGSTVTAEVDLGANTTGGYGIGVRLDIALPALDAEAAQQLIEAAHLVCPYSNATRGNIDVALNLAGVAA